MNKSSSNVEYREIQVEDIPVLFQIRIDTWHNTNGDQELKDLGITHESVKKLIQSKSHFGWIALIHQKTIGFAMGDIEKGEMWVIAVLKDFEGKGIGTELLHRVENDLWNAGWSEIWLTTDLDDSQRCVGFYKHLGWTDWKFENDRFMKKLKPK